MYESKLLSKTKWLLVPLMLLLMAISMIGFITPAKAAENTDLRDQVTEAYIKEHVDSKYTSAEKTELKKHKCVKTREYLDIREKDDKMFSGQEISNLPFEKKNNKVFTVTYLDVRKEQTKFDFNGLEQPTNNDKVEK